MRADSSVVTVLVAGSLVAEFDELFSLLILETTGQRRRAEVEHCEQMGELVALLERRTFDLAFLYLHLISPPRSDELQFKDRHEIHKLAREDAFITCLGHAMIHFLRRTHDIPVVVLTGSGYLEDTKYVKQAGADAFFPVPFNPKRLVESLRAILWR